MFGVVRCRHLESLLGGEKRTADLSISFMTDHLKIIPALPLSHPSGKLLGNPGLFVLLDGSKILFVLFDRFHEHFQQLFCVRRTSHDPGVDALLFSI